MATARTHDETTGSALVVLVPAAEPVVGAWRQRLDPAARLGVPAHITVLYPFLPLDALTHEVRGRLRDVFAATPGFTVHLTDTSWFGDDVLYCAPEPAEPLIGLTRRVLAEFPAQRPYGGAHDEIVPHLTVGDAAPRADLERAESAVRSGLPLVQVVDAVHLLVGGQHAGSWAVHERFALGSQPAAGGARPT